MVGPASTVQTAPGIIVTMSVGSTVKVTAVEVCPPKAAVISEVPAVTPVARPLVEMVATAGVAEVQTVVGAEVTMRVEESL
jgi:hypothetical protein